MKLNHETVSLLLAVGTLATAVLALRLARRERSLQAKAKLLVWASEDAARYERQRAAWHALSVRLAKVRAAASGTNFLKKEGKAAGYSCPGYISHLRGIRVKALRFLRLASQWVRMTGMAGASNAAAKCSNSWVIGNRLLMSNVGGAL